ncbi:putative signal transduction response regulator, reiver domain [Candidatus Nitrosocosmicus arcticus]|uniref:Putative signal transduction response regulator, reiver domain n=1 Tax=Candidatus Nitrosocosmicus arcticus TaxID=2035267 RepID=A0A557SXH4_9ARCH|nr:putative signal transduction response regulator, reiver domain [Candidatus Nitrosocosmicus arcticus]
MRLDSVLSDQTKNTSSNNNQNRLMIVDDETDLLFVYKKALELTGMEIFTFDSPDLAFKEFIENSEKYSLLLTDMRMPSMNGYELINKVKAIRPEIKIILISAYNITQDEINRNLDPTSKIDGLICKPIGLERLREIINECLIMNN